MKRPRISIRLMLLVVALFAVSFAWLGALKELRRVRLQGELETLILNRQLTVNWRHNFISDEAWRETMTRVEAEIEKKRKLLGHSPR